MKHILEKLIDGFRNVFGDTKNVRFYFAPGRINLIGEHIDYNGGHVFPYAIDNGTYALVKERSDRRVRLYSHNIKINSQIYETVIDDDTPSKTSPWVNYPKGIFKYIMKAGFKIPSGLDIYYYGNIPGSGLSSSASLEVVTATLVNDIFELNIDKKEIAKICQKVENEYIHVNCGIMDQFASVFGLKDHAIFLDCQNLDFEYVPLNLDLYYLVATNSNVSHSLGSSKYNERRNECNIALSEIKKVKNIDNLCQLSIEEFESLSSNIKDDIIRKRASYVVKEEDRVKKLVKALSNNDINLVSKLINDSGDGIKDEYEATCEEIDFLVSSARSIDGCIASRMTGGGWGGNIISIVEKSKTKRFVEELQTLYNKKFRKLCLSSILKCSDGAKRLKYDLY